MHDDTHATLMLLAWAFIWLCGAGMVCILALAAWRIAKDTWWLITHQGKEDHDA